MHGGEKEKCAEAASRAVERLLSYSRDMSVTNAAQFCWSFLSTESRVEGWRTRFESCFAPLSNQGSAGPWLCSPPSRLPSYNDTAQFCTFTSRSHAYLYTHTLLHRARLGICAGAGGWWRTTLLSKHKWLGTTTHNRIKFHFYFDSLPRKK